MSRPIDVATEGYLTIPAIPVPPKPATNGYTDPFGI